MRFKYPAMISAFQFIEDNLPLTKTPSFLISISPTSQFNASAATPTSLSFSALQATSTALPFKSAVALAADGEVLAIR